METGRRIKRPAALLRAARKVCRAGRSANGFCVSMLKIADKRTRHHGLYAWPEGVLTLRMAVRTLAGLNPNSARAEAMRPVVLMLCDLIDNDPGTLVYPDGGVDVLQYKD